MSPRTLVWYSALALAGFYGHADASCMHGTSHLERRVTPEGTVAVSRFGYTNLQGPLNWASLAPENIQCSTGTVQSPINLDSNTQRATVVPVITIPNVPAAEFENLGTTVEVIVNGTTTLGTDVFNLKQFHVHTPSEHRINEEYFPLEIHMVHEAADGSGRIAVMAVLFQLSADGATTELLTSVTQNLAQIATPGTITTTGPLDFAPLVTHLTTTPLLQYTGSLTTPPCSEGLTFLVTQQPLPINVQTFNSLKSIVKFNSRYTQNQIGQENLLGIASNVLEAAAANASTGNPVTPSGSAFNPQPVASMRAAMVLVTELLVAGPNGQQQVIPTSMLAPVLLAA